MGKIKEEHLDLMTDEKLLTQTAFGIVTTKRVIYYSGKKWF